VERLQNDATEKEVGIERARRAEVRRQQQEDEPDETMSDLTEAGCRAR